MNKTKKTSSSHQVVHKPIIEIKGLDKTYKNGDHEIPVLKEVDLTINTTDFAIIYGPSGCGKSTLLHHIVGLETPTKGSVKIRGQEISSMTPEEQAHFRADKFGIVYQAMYWVRSLNVLENVAMPLLIANVPEKTAYQKAYWVLHEIGMHKLAKKRPTQLSGGEQQRVALARALINDPWIIIADEPTGNLDTHSSDMVMDMLQKLNINQKRTVVMVTHNMIYLPIATRLISIRDGQILSSNARTVKNEIKQELEGIL